MIPIKDTFLVPKIIFPVISNKDQLRKILNVNQWDKFNEPLLYKLKLAAEIFFNRYIYYHLKDTIPFKKKIFMKACKYANMEIIQLMIEKIESEFSTLSPDSRNEKEINNWNLGLIHACKGGHMTIVHLMIGKGANDWNWGLYYACKKGCLSIVLLMINKGANNWNNGLINACRGDHLLIVHLMIEKGANYWNWGLRSACRKGHLSIIDLMIKKGADNWNWGLAEACNGGHLPIVNLMIKKGANNLNRALEIANDKKHLEIINYLSKLIKKLKIN